MKTILTFEEFQKTGRNVVFADGEPGFEHSRFGRVYENGCFINLMDEGHWYLLIERNEYVGDLLTLEKRLYNEWYIPQHPAERPSWSDHVYKEVFSALDNAEGMYGPIGSKYVELMMRVVAECNKRILTYVTSDQYRQDAIPPITHGAPGLGKSYTVTEEAKKIGLSVLDLSSVSMSTAQALTILRNEFVNTAVHRTVKEALMVVEAILKQRGCEEHGTKDGKLTSLMDIVIFG